MKKVNSVIYPKEIDGWVKFTPLLVDHGNSQPIEYKVIRPEKESSVAVIYLHGLGGNKDESPHLDNLFTNSLSISIVRMKYPILISFQKLFEGDILQNFGFLAGFNSGTLFQIFHNTSKAIDAISEKEGFTNVGIIGVSLGGFSAIVNAIRGCYTKKVMLLSSTPDIAFAMENFHELFRSNLLDDLFLRPGLRKVFTNIRIEARNIRRGKGLFRHDWNRINPWIKPLDNDVEIYCLGNMNDPIMPGSSLHKYKQWMLENYRFENIHIKTVDGPPKHGELKSASPHSKELKIDLIKEFKDFFSEL